MALNSQILSEHMGIIFSISWNPSHEFLIRCITGKHPQSFFPIMLHMHIVNIISHNTEAPSQYFYKISGAALVGYTLNYFARTLYYSSPKHLKSEWHPIALK